MKSSTSYDPSNSGGRSLKLRTSAIDIVDIDVVPDVRSPSIDVVDIDVNPDVRTSVLDAVDIDVNPDARASTIDVVDIDVIPSLESELSMEIFLWKIGERVSFD